MTVNAREALSVRHMEAAYREASDLKSRLQDAALRSYLQDTVKKLDDAERQLCSYRDTGFKYRGHRLLVDGVTDMELAMFKVLMYQLLEDRNMHLAGDLRW